MDFISDEKIIHSMSSTNEPIAEVKPGETFVVKTRGPGIPDEVFEKDYSDGQYPQRILSITGPIYIQDAEPGDVLEIAINDIEFDEEGKMWMGQWMGILMDEVQKPYLRKVKVKDGKAFFSEEITFPVRPMIGTLGVAPSEGEIACLYPGVHGGNMDVPSVAPGNKLYLPVQVKGALLATGDVHAGMGDGEVFGTGIEIGSKVTMTVNVIKGKKLRHPMVETPNSYEIIVSNEDLVEATKEATREMISFLQERLKLTFEEAYALTGQVANLKFGQVVNPIYTISIEVSKSLLEGQQ
ncbi:acetamidase/formamidase family protein [Natronincola ferrireducens]|uniref:Amidase n=1 Tax=Natronincola ferrireducens TaxID=393762 RepID=A0A1G9G234_9FIRM|nr:acetamidase/formamidase family protein [Natronincola ferrireducens]SDK94667.1 amidase [Natronincola ferrireducens]